MMKKRSTEKEWSKQGKHPLAGTSSAQTPNLFSASKKGFLKLTKVLRSLATRVLVLLKIGSLQVSTREWISKVEYS